MAQNASESKYID